MTAATTRVTTGTITGLLFAIVLTLIVAPSVAAAESAGRTCAKDRGTRYEPVHSRVHERQCPRRTTTTTEPVDVSPSNLPQAQPGATTTTVVAKGAPTSTTVVAKGAPTSTTVVAKGAPTSTTAVAKGAPTSTTAVVPAPVSALDSTTTTTNPAATESVSSTTVIGLIPPISFVRPPAPEFARASNPARSDVESVVPAPAVEIQVLGIQATAQVLPATGFDTQHIARVAALVALAGMGLLAWAGRHSSDRL